MMMDWNAYRDQLIERTKEIAAMNPELIAGYQGIAHAGRKTGKLDAKTRELIALAVAITLRCDGCISHHAHAAKRAGATAEEITEALGVATMVNTGAALVYSARTLDAFAAQG